MCACVCVCVCVCVCLCVVCVCVHARVCRVFLDPRNLYDVCTSFHSTLSKYVGGHELYSLISDMVAKTFYIHINVYYL